MEPSAGLERARVMALQDRSALFHYLQRWQVMKLRDVSECYVLKWFVLHDIT